MSKKKRSEKVLEALDLGSVKWPGWAKRIPFDEYLKTRRVSSHSMMDFNRSPRLYKRKTDGLAPGISSSAMTFGTAFHCYVLEGADEFNRQYQVGGPINQKTGKPYGPTTKAFLEFADKCPQKIITEADYATIVEMYQGVMGNTTAQLLLSDGIPEASIFTKVANIDVKMRLDWWIDSKCMNMDMKTTKSIDYFVDDFWKYQYDIQVGMFGLIMNSVIHKVPQFCIMACEKSEPYATKVFEISGETMHAAMMKVSSLLFKLDGCLQDDIWPYGTEVDGVI